MRFRRFGLADGRVYIRRSIWEGEEVTVKTKQGYRAVTIDPILTGMLAGHVGNRKTGSRLLATRGQNGGKIGSTLRGVQEVLCRTR